MASNVPFINFSLLWKVEWSEFRELSQRRIKKLFSTSYDSVTFFWSVKMITDDRGVEPNEFGIFLVYLDGPLATVEKINFKVAFIKPESPNVKTRSIFFSNHTIGRGTDWGWSNFDARNANDFQKKYGFANNKPLLCQITLQIPTTAFSFAYQPPLPTTTAPWMVDLFKNIKNPETNKFSNAKLISSNGEIFYCDKVVLAQQSKEFATMFNFPQPEGQDENTYPFPKMGAGSLKAMVEFFYTGQASVAGLATPTIIELVDAAEQYKLEKLKESCRATLWSRLLGKNFPVRSCVEIICFADLHDDFKYVKQRAMEILAGKCVPVRQSILCFFKEFGIGQRGDELAEEFMTYCAGRVEGYFMM